MISLLHCHEAFVDVCLCVDCEDTTHHARTHAKTHAQVFAANKRSRITPTHRKACRNMSQSLEAMAKAMAMMGPIRGEMSIEATTVTLLFCARPAAATIEPVTIMAM